MNSETDFMNQDKNLSNVKLTDCHAEI